MEDVFNIDWQQTGWNAALIIGAFILALPVGMNRERAERLGLRTIPLVAVASCGFILLSQHYTDQNAQARILSGIVTGIGFLGGGAILKRGDTVHGTATAASIWTTAAIGAAVAFRRWEVAILLAVINVLILVTLGPIGERMKDDGEDRPPEDVEEDGDEQ